MKTIPSVPIRDAREEDIPTLVAMFAEDDKGGHGDTTDPSALPDYLCAFQKIMADPGSRILVVEHAGQPIGTAQVTVSTSLTGRGASKLTIGAVQVRADMRGRGFGEALIRYCIALGEQEGVTLIELMSNSSRTDAHRFYERLGFAKTHFAFKMKLR